MKSILILTNSIDGLFWLRREVVQAIVDSGHRVFISYPRQGDSDRFFEEMGCRMILTPFNRVGKNPIRESQLIYRYYSIVKRISPAVVLSYTVKPNIYGGIVCSICKIPQIVNITGLGDWMERKSVLRILIVTLYKICFGRRTVFFFQNRNNQRLFMNLGIVGSHNSKLIPGSGVNLSFHSFQDYPPDGIVRFLFVARLKKDKGTQEYFDAARAIKEINPSVDFQVVGPDEDVYREQLDSLVQDGVITYFGRQMDVRPYYKNVHCTVMPSYHEGMSNVNLEGSSSGRPVITTNVPGCVETVDDGITGFLVEPRNTCDLVRKMEKFIDLPYSQKKEMGRAARKKMEREFDRNIVSKLYVDEIDRLLDYSNRCP